MPCHLRGIGHSPPHPTRPPRKEHTNPQTNGNRPKIHLAVQPHCLSMQTATCTLRRAVVRRTQQTRPHNHRAAETTEGGRQAAMKCQIQNTHTPHTKKTLALAPAARRLIHSQPRRPSEAPQSLRCCTPCPQSTARASPSGLGTHGGGGTRTIPFNGHRTGAAMAAGPKREDGYIQSINNNSQCSLDPCWCQAEQKLSPVIAISHCFGCTFSQSANVPDLPLLLRRA